jgi:hypothetical protein
MAALPVARDVGDHEARTRLQHDLVGEAPLGVRPRLRAFHPDVTGAHQAEEELAAVRCSEVESDVEGVPALLDERGGDRHAVRFDGHVQGPPGIDGPARMLDVDDLGTESRREVRGVGLGDERTGGEDLHALERAERLRDESGRSRHACTSVGPRARFRILAPVRTPAVRYLRARRWLRGARSKPTEAPDRSRGPPSGPRRRPPRSRSPEGS